MEVILQQNFPALGYVGDTIKVKGGYARNYLIPRGIAIEASIRNKKLLKHLLGGVNARKVKMRSEAQELATQIETIALEYTLRVGAGGKTFGSVTSRDIESALKEKGVLIDKRQVILTEPIRKPGEHKVNIKLHSEVICALKVQVNSEIPEQKAKPEAKAEEGEAAKGKEKPARKPRARKAKGKEGQEGEAPAAEGGASAAPSDSEQEGKV